VNGDDFLLNGVKVGSASVTVTGGTASELAAALLSWVAAMTL